jgi:hypothetical protein
MHQGLLVAVVALAVLLAACGSGSSSGSATDRACSAKDDLSASLRKVGQDAKAGNLGDALDQLSDARTKASDLASAVSDLTAQEKTRLQPQIQAFQEDLKALGDVRSVSDLRSALTALQASSTRLTNDLDEDLDCS